MRIAALLPTHHLPEEAIPWMQEVRSVFDELVIFIDERRATPGTVTRAEGVGTRILANKAETWYAADRLAMLAACESDWVFTIEYDEQLSPEWHQHTWRQILEKTPFTHFWCLRQWILPSARYISGNPWSPDFQLRLFRNKLEGTEFPSKLHENVFIPGLGACFRNLSLYHHVLWLMSRAQREDKVRSYEHLRPGSSDGYYYLYEDHKPPKAPLPGGRKLDVSREILQIHKFSPEEILKISLKVEGVPKSISASQLFWLAVEVTNATRQNLSSSPSPFSVNLSYHWIDQGTRRMFVFDGRRSGLWPGAPAATTTTGTMMIIAPDQPGQYILQTTMVQEGVCWFEDVQADILQEFSISVTA